MTAATASPDLRSQAAPLHDPLLADELARILAEHCEHQFADVPELMRATLIDVQQRARLGGFTAAHPDAVAWLLPRDGRIAGYAIIDETTADTRVIDLVVRPASRRCGIASAFLDELIDRADAAGRAIALSVAPGSDAERLYLARGFVPAAGVDAPDALHRELRREAASIPEPEEGTR